MEVTLHTAEATEVSYELGFSDVARQSLANPELAFLLLSLGTLAVVYELDAPGAGLAGAVGVILPASAP